MVLFFNDPAEDIEYMKRGIESGIVSAERLALTAFDQLSAFLRIGASVRPISASSAGLESSTASSVHLRRISTPSMGVYCLSISHSAMARPLKRLMPRVMV